VAAAFRDAGFTQGTIVARNAQAGQALAATYGFAWRPDLPEEHQSVPVPILVNVTPLGMDGADADALAFPMAMIARCDLAFDVVALPVETPFLRAAKAFGKATIDGGEVGLLQALAQFVLYTGVTPSPDQTARAAAFARG
jgi:shikimate dehydrogenase